ncbi:MAG: mevalonate kinase [Candidatus Micrarchaeia archaeon]
MNSVEVLAPGVIKLFGEHAVVYGKMSVAAAISLYAKCRAERVDLANENKAFEINLKDLNKHIDITNEEIDKIYNEYINRKSIEEFVNAQRIDKEILPYVVIAGRIRKERNLSLSNIDISITSDIPITKGLASSAACSVAYTVALTKLLNVNMPDSQLIELAREGDKIIHRSEGAGKIDINTSYFGGYVSYNSERGARKEDIDAKCKFILVDTGPKKKTSETVGHVAELYNKDKDQISKVFDEIEQCSIKGLEMLEKKNIYEVGALMYKNHELLNKLEVSSNGLNKTVELAKKYNQYGAKLSGGGGGGLAVVLAGNSSTDFIDALKKEGFNAFEADISKLGAKEYNYINNN